MARHFWEDEVERFDDVGVNDAERANFLASPASVVVGPNLLSYTLPEGYQPAGEGFEHAVGEGDIYYYQPALKSDDRDGGRWSMIPCVIRLEMDTLELVDVIDLTPEIPQTEGGEHYRDCLAHGGGGPLFDEGIAQAGFASWGRIADCYGMVPFLRSSGALHTILRVGDWLIPQISSSNQLYAYNLNSLGTPFFLRGWDDVPQRLRLLDPQTDPAEDPEDQRIDFLPYTHEREIYNVLGSAGGTKVLILREVQTIECEVVSDFTGTRTDFREMVYEETTSEVSGYIKELWVNASGSTGANIVIPEGGLFRPFNWDEGAFLCGGLIGEPWSGNPIPPLPDHADERTRAQAASEMIAALSEDLAYVAAKTNFFRARTVASIITLELWDFPVEGSPVWEEDIYTWDDETWTTGQVLRGATEWTIEETTYGALPVAVDTAYEDNYVLDLEYDPDYYQRADSDFSLGAGVMLHAYWAVTVPGESYVRFGITSEDRNNCPGPGGPWLDVGFVDTNPTEECILTRMKTPAVEIPYLPKPANWHPGKLATNGAAAIFAPREQGASMRYTSPDGVLYGNQFGGSEAETDEWNAAVSAQATIRCLPLILDGPNWSVSALDHVDPFSARSDGESNPVYDELSGSSKSNGLITAQFYYVVLRHGETGQRLLKIRVADLLDEEEALVEAGGTVVATVDLSTPIAGSDEVYHDPLVVINRRCVGVGSTSFFEITTA